MTDTSGLRRHPARRVYTVYFTPDGGSSNYWGTYHTSSAANQATTWLLKDPTVALVTVDVIRAAPRTAE